MKRINLTIKAKAPMAVGQRKPGGSVSEAMDYIPGTVIRGAIAARILNLANSAPEVDADGNDDDFRRLFIGEGAAIFQNAYPAIAKLGEDKYTDDTGEVLVLPATALSAKADSGFKTSSKEEKTGVFDSLIDSFCAREQGLFYEPNDLEGNRVEPFRGFYSKKASGKGKPRYVSHSVSKRLLTRVGINRRRATAQDNLLYSIEVLNESQGNQSKCSTTYRSSILVDDDDLATQLNKFLKHESDHFRLGGSASRGLGKVQVDSEIEDISASFDGQQKRILVSDAPVKGSDSVKRLKRRIDEFNALLKKRWNLWTVFSGAESNQLDQYLFFSINLQADAILKEDWRRTMVLSPKMLCQFLGLGSDYSDLSDQEAIDDFLKLEIAYASYDYQSGWNNGTDLRS